MRSAIAAAAIAQFVLGASVLGAQGQNLAGTNQTPDIVMNCEYSDGTPANQCAFYCSFNQGYTAQGRNVIRVELFYAANNRDRWLLYKSYEDGNPPPPHPDPTKIASEYLYLGTDASCDFNNLAPAKIPFGLKFETFNSK
jgi:hypothetical protein